MVFGVCPKILEQGAMEWVDVFLWWNCQSTSSTVPMHCILQMMVNQQTVLFVDTLTIRSILIINHNLMAKKNCQHHIPSPTPSLALETLVSFIAMTGPLFPGHTCRPMIHPQQLFFIKSGSWLVGKFQNVCGNLKTDFLLLTCQFWDKLCCSVVHDQITCQNRQPA